MGCLGSKQKAPKNGTKTLVLSPSFDSYPSQSPASSIVKPPLLAQNSSETDEDSWSGSGEFEESPLTPILKEYLTRWKETTKNLASDVKKQEKQLHVPAVLEDVRPI